MKRITELKENEIFVFGSNEAGFQECVKYLSGQEKGNDR